MTKYYTGIGDKGDTSVMGGKKLSKEDVLIDAIGDVDELNSYTGVSLFYIRDEQIRFELKSVQNDLFTIGAILASILYKSDKTLSIDKAKIDRLESLINTMGNKMPELKKFVIPGGSEGALHLHVARSIARRAERKVVAASKKYAIDKNVLSYMNRLSSFFFVTALYLNFTNGVEESHPIY